MGAYKNDGGSTYTTSVAVLSKLTLYVLVSTVPAKYSFSENVKVIV